LKRGTSISEEHTAFISRPKGWDCILFMNAGTHLHACTASQPRRPTWTKEKIVWG
jgi:hypothetical protein